MSAQGFFGRVWHDSRRSVPAPSVGPMSTTPALPVFQDSPVTKAGRKSAPEAGRAVPHDQLQSSAVTAKARAGSRFASLAQPAPNLPEGIMELRFSRLKFQLQSTPTEPVQSLEQPQPRPGQSIRYQGMPPDLVPNSVPDADDTSWVTQGQPTANGSTRTQPVPDESTQFTDTPLTPELHERADRARQPARFEQEESNGYSAKEAAAFHRVEASEKVAPDQVDEAVAATAQKSAPVKAKRDNQAAAVTPDTDLHIGEVRIRLVESPKPATSARPALTATESDSRRLLRGL